MSFGANEILIVLQIFVALLVLAGVAYAAGKIVGRLNDLDGHVNEIMADVKALGSLESRVGALEARSTDHDREILRLRDKAHELSNQLQPLLLDKGE